MKIEHFGVWTAEFTLSSIGDYLQELKEGFKGAFFIASADKTGATSQGKLATFSC